METLQIAALVAGLVSPIVSGAAWWGATRQRLKTLEAHIQTCQAAHDACRAAREDEEDKIHGRVTKLSESFNYYRGRLNGHGGARDANS